MLQIRDLDITHTKDLKTLIKGFNCTLNPGDKAVLIGEEGNGKSTLLKWIYDPSLVESYAEADGTRVIQSEILAYLPQMLPEHDTTLSVYEYLYEQLHGASDGHAEMAQLASQFSLDPELIYSSRLMKTLSGGEKIKIQMLRILQQHPTSLLLDEPSNDIDIDTLRWMEDLISSFDGIVLYISHDETLIENTANMVIHLERIFRKRESRYTVARMPYRQYAEERLKSLDKQEQQARADIRDKRQRDERLMRIEQKVEHAQNSVSRSDPHGGRLLKKKMKSVKSLERRFSREDDDMTEMPYTEEAINFRLGGPENIMPPSKTFLEYGPADLVRSDGNGVLSRSVSLTARGPEKIGIIGRNGAGKTTLMKELLTVLYGRDDIRVQYMPQNYTDMLDPAQTAVGSIARSGNADERKLIRNWLAALRFTAEEMDRPVCELSGGQQAKIFLLMMNTSSANVLLLDEPTRNFSPLSGPVIRRMLASFPGAIISISHDRKYLSEVCTRILELGPGGLKETYI